MEEAKAVLFIAACIFFCAYAAAYIADNYDDFDGFGY